MYRLNRKRSFLALLALAILISMGIYAVTAVPQTEIPEKPNIVFIVADDLDLASMAELPKMKTLMADEGTTFSNHFVSLALCCPSRASMLCGQYAHNTGVTDNYPPAGGFSVFYEADKEDSTIATWLQDAGYKTALFGKYLNGYPGTDVAKTYIPPGWSDWAVPVKGNAYKEFDYSLNENGEIVSYGHKPADYMTTVLEGKADDFIAANAENEDPFFLYLSLYAPHEPSVPEPQYKDAFADAVAPRTPAYNEEDTSDKPEWTAAVPLMDELQAERVDASYRRRLQTMLSVEDLVENVVATLEENGELENTYIIFTSDNGFHMGDHRLPLGKSTAYDSDIHVPLIIRGPDVPKGEVVDELTANIDFAPTFAELAGITIPGTVDGRSFVSLWREKVRNWRTAILLEHDANVVKPKNTDDEGLLEPEDSSEVFRVGMPSFIGVRTSQYTYVSYANGEKELYDNAADPYQVNNIAATASKELLDALEAQSEALSTCSGEVCREAEDRKIP